MRLLILSALCPMSFAVALGLMVWTNATPPTLDGEIVMEQASFCDLFVIETDEGLAIAIDESHWPLAISSGTRVSGLQRQKGTQTILVNDQAQLRIRVTQWQTDWKLAQAAFEQACDPATPGLRFEMKSEGSAW